MDNDTILRETCDAAHAAGSPAVRSAVRSAGESCRPAVTRRAVLVALGLLPIAACSASPALSPVLGRAAEQLRATTLGMEDAPVTRAYVEELPYASQLVRIGKGPRSLMILAQQQGDDLYWIGADRTVLVTRQGRITQSGGLEKGLGATQFPEGVALANLHGKAGLQTRRMLDLPYRQQYGVPALGVLRREGRETITVLGRTYTCVRYRETVEVPLLKWKHENVFWLDEQTGALWRSRQHLSPALPAVDMALTKAVAP